jgi:hypothetical protein
VGYRRHILLPHAPAEFAVFGADLDAVALVNMTRHANLRPSLDRRHLRHRRRSIPARRVRRIRDLDFDVLGQFDLHDLVFDLQHADPHVRHHETLLQLRHMRRADVDLLVTRRVHENEHVAVAVKVFPFLAVEDDLLDIVVGRETLFDDIAAFEVLQLDLPVGAQVAAGLLVPVEDDPNLVASFYGCFSECARGIPAGPEVAKKRMWALPGSA